MKKSPHFHSFKIRARNILIIWPDGNGLFQTLWHFLRN